LQIITQIKKDKSAYAWLEKKNLFQTLDDTIEQLHQDIQEIRALLDERADSE
jgi:hypothetical protein